jgi:hypothetical protein
MTSIIRPLLAWGPRRTDNKQVDDSSSVNDLALALAGMATRVELDVWRDIA